jgi:hypothetical protein
MKILVLDTIHGGLELRSSLREQGHFIDVVDVYRGKYGIDADTASQRDYDLVVAPIHLDPEYHLLQDLPTPRITHHQAVRWIIGRNRPKPFVEVTGARGKTTTACALAGLMEGPGILHTSIGTFRYPGRELLWKQSITPASIIPACSEAMRMKGWLIAEVSLGLTGSGDMGIITSAEDYTFAQGKRHAREEKIRSGVGMPRLLVAPGIDITGAVPVSSLVNVDGETCRYPVCKRSGSFINPLLNLEGYRTPLMLAAAAGCLLGLDPAGLTTFRPVEGRMNGTWLRDGLYVMDNSNSGTNGRTAVQAASTAQRISGKRRTTLVIGKEAGSVCEGFPPGDVEKAIADITPDTVILVGEGYDRLKIPPGVKKTVAGSLQEGRERAIADTSEGCIVLAVKSWR